MSTMTVEQSRQETVEALQRREIAERLVGRLLAGDHEQLQLFQSEREKENVSRHDKGLKMMREDQPGRLVLDADVVDEYRYKAAMYGAGFHPSQFDEISWQKNELAGMNTVYLGVLAGMWRVHHHPDVIGRANRMRDEVREERFAQLVPSTDFEHRFGHPVYITSEEDLVKIFEFDQSNIAACKWLDDDLLYEREN